MKVLVEDLGCVIAAGGLGYSLWKHRGGETVPWRRTFAIFATCVAGYVLVRPWADFGWPWAVAADMALGAFACGFLVHGARAWSGRAWSWERDWLAAAVVLASAGAQTIHVLLSTDGVTSPPFRTIRLVAIAVLCSLLSRSSDPSRRSENRLSTVLLLLAVVAAARLALAVYWPNPAVSSVIDTFGGLAWAAIALRAMVRLHAERTADRVSNEALRVDPVSGLLRREPFLSAVRELTSTATLGRGVALTFFDLDRFRALNDSLGHAAGDAALGEVGKRLAQALPRGAVAARLGGDEFALAVPFVKGAEEALEISQLLTGQVSEPLVVGATEVILSASSGTSFFPGDAPDAVALVEHARAAAYAAKNLGRGRGQMYTKALVSSQAGTLEKETRLRRALSLGEIWVYYQPRVDLVTRRVDGFEALARWLHPSEGLLAAGAFMELAEATGLVVPISYFVLEQACMHTRDAREESGEPIVVSVNVSAHQLVGGELYDRVDHVLASTRLPPEALELEVTETAALHDLEQARRVLGRLRGRGVSIALDDFGTGHSALGYLKHLPVDRVKIDRCFVRDVAQDRRDRLLIRTIVDLARARGLSVTAEGVESVAQLRFVARAGCDHAQGYLLGSARPSPDLAKMAGTQPIDVKLKPRRRFSRQPPSSSVSAE